LCRELAAPPSATPTPNLAFKATERFRLPAEPFLFGKAKADIPKEPMKFQVKAILGRHANSLHHLFSNQILKF
jgi:hypothetical protein